MPNIMPSVEAKLKLELITNRKFDKLDVKENCKLREAIEPSRMTFVRGRAYYEFINGKENTTPLSCPRSKCCFFKCDHAGKTLNFRSS